MRGRVIEAQCLLLTYHWVPLPRFRAAVTLSLATHFSDIFLAIFTKYHKSLYDTSLCASLFFFFWCSCRTDSIFGLMPYLHNEHVEKLLIDSPCVLFFRCYSTAQRSKVTQRQTGKEHISQPATGTCIFLHSELFSLVTYLHPAYLHAQ